MPVFIGIVGDGNCDGSAWRAILQQKINDILTEHQKLYKSTPLVVLCRQRNDFERAAFETAIKYASDSMEFQDTDDDTIAKTSQLLFCIHSREAISLHHLIEIRLGYGANASDIRNLLYQRQRGPVWEFTCSEKGVESQLRYPKHPSEKNPAKHYRIVWKHIDQFNSDVEVVQDSNQLSLLVPKNSGKHLSKANQALLKQFEICDYLATFNQKRSLAIYLALFFFSFAFIFFFDIYPNVIKGTPFRADFYFVSLVLAFVVYGIGRIKNYENKYLDYRALAEGTRVQFFWSLADLQKPAADYYLHKSESELIWIRSALRNWHILSQRQDRSDPLSKEERLKMTLKSWIENQHHYFSKTGHKNKQQLKILKNSSTGLFYVTLALAIYSLIPKPGGWVTASIGLAASIGALMKGYIQKRGLAEHLKQYSRMAELYAFALEHSNLLKDEQSATVLIEELGKEALAENSEWVLLHRERHITFPNPL